MPKLSQIRGGWSVNDLAAGRVPPEEAARLHEGLAEATGRFAAAMYRAAGETPPAPVAAAPAAAPATTATDDGTQQ